MPQSLTDTLNLGASIVTMLGALVSLGRAVAPRRQSTKPAVGARKSGRPRRSAAPSPTLRPQPTQGEAKGAAHPAILGFATVGLLTITAYSVELAVNYVQSGATSTVIAAGSPLIGVNAVLLTINLVCVVAACAGVMITAFRYERRGWVVAGALTLAVALFSLGIFSVVALVPAVFYGLSGPRESDALNY